MTEKGPQTVQESSKTAQQGPKMAQREPHDGPRWPQDTPQALQIVTQSSRETVVRGKVAQGSPQRPLEGAQEASRGPHGARKKVSWSAKEALKGGASARITEEGGEGFAGRGDDEEEGEE